MTFSPGTHHPIKSATHPMQVNENAGCREHVENIRKTQVAPSLPARRGGRATSVPGLVKAWFGQLEAGSWIKEWAHTQKYC